MNTYKDKYIKYKKKYIELKYRMKGGTISCPVCTFINKDGIKKCEMCGADLKQKQDFPGKKLIDKFLKEKDKNNDLAKVQFRNLIQDTLNPKMERKGLLGYINTKLGPEYEKIYDSVLENFIIEESKKDAKTKPKHQREEKKSIKFPLSLYNHNGSIVLSYENKEDYKNITTFLQSKEIEILDTDDKKTKIIYTKKYSVEEAIERKRPVINGKLDTGISMEEFLNEFKIFRIGDTQYTIKINTSIYNDFISENLQKVITDINNQN